MLDTLAAKWSYLFDFATAAPGHVATAVADHPAAFGIVGVYAAAVLIATAAVTHRANNR